MLGFATADHNLPCFSDNTCAVFGITNMPNPRSFFPGFLALLLAACASPREVLETGTRTTFSSTRSAGDLLRCIDRNADGYALNSLKTEVKNMGHEPFEIVFWNGNFVNSVAQVRSTTGGSTADFRFGGSAIMPDATMKIMTKGCE
jgi:hypothetical protein